MKTGPPEQPSNGRAFYATKSSASSSREELTPFLSGPRVPRCGAIMSMLGNEDTFDDLHQKTRRSEVSPSPHWA
jgi:hypothetical protein